MQVDRLLFACKASPAETRPNNYGRYTYLIKSHILCHALGGGTGIFLNNY